MATAKRPKRRPRANSNPEVISASQAAKDNDLHPEINLDGKHLRLGYKKGATPSDPIPDESVEAAVRGRLGELMSYLQNAGGRAYDNIGRADDAVQGFIRNKVYGLPEDGSALSEDAAGYGIRSLMGKIHRNRADSPVDTYFKGTGTMNDNAGIIATRAAELGGLTAAGAGLLNLTHLYQNQFGQPADEQASGQLPML